MGHRLESGVMLTYRMIATLKGDKVVSNIVEPEIYRWLDQKRLAKAELSAKWTDLGNGVRGAKYSAGSHNGGDLRTRYVLQEASGFETRITVDLQAERSCRFWIEVDSPEASRPAATPNIVRKLLGAVEARDGALQLTDSPRLVTPHDLGELYESINDAERASPILVAGTPSDFPLDKWRDLVARITHRTVGMAASVVLDAEATEAFVDMFDSNDMAPRYGAIRTYQPGAYLDDESDSARHKTLGTSAILENREEYLARVLEAAVRRTTVSVPLPAELRRVGSVLAKAQFLDLVGPNRAADRASVADETDEHGDRVIARQRGNKTPHTRRPKDVDALSKFALRVKEAVAPWVESWPPTFADEQVILQRLAESPKDVTERTKQASEQLERLEIERDQFSERLASTERQLEDYDLELAFALEQLRALEIERDRLRVELQRANLAEVAWAPADTPFVTPTDYWASIDQARAMPHLIFSIDDDEVAELQAVSDSVSRPQQMLQAFVALSDYARVRHSGEFQGGFREYVKSPPDGCKTIPAKWLADGESKSVKSDPRMAAQRVFKVPKELDPSERLVAYRHLRFGNDTRDPRVYFHDDVLKSGKVWILYVGRHKDVKSTN